MIIQFPSTVDLVYSSNSSQLQKHCSADLGQESGEGEPDEQNRLLGLTPELGMGKLGMLQKATFSIDAYLFERQ